MEEVLLRLLENTKEGVRIDEIIKSLNISKKNNKKIHEIVKDLEENGKININNKKIRRLLKKLEDCGKIYKNSDEKYLLFPANYGIGTIYENENGNLFVLTNTSKYDIDNSLDAEVSNKVVYEVLSNGKAQVKKVLVKQGIEISLLNYIKSNEFNMSFKEIKKLLNTKNDDEINEFLKNLEESEILYLDENNNYIKFPSNYKIATIFKNEFGSFDIKIENQKMSVKENLLFDLNDGDVVVVDMTEIPPIIKKTLQKQVSTETLFLENLETTSLNKSFKDIKNLLNITSVNDEKLRTELKRLEFSEKLYCDKNGIYNRFPNNYKTAVIGATKNKVFVEIPGHGKINLKREDLNGALLGDKVVVEITSGKKPKAIIKKVLKRENKMIVCEIGEKEGIKYLIPFNVISDLKLRINHISMKHLSVGDRISVEISENMIDDVYEADFRQIIGHKDDPDIDLKCIAISYGFKLDFSEEAKEQLKSIPTTITDSDLIGRHDLRKEMIFTIDGESAKDLDDAISIKKLDNGHYILGVHIAHVSNYIKPDTPLFDEVLERGTSLYMIDSVIPMLPHEISNGICSLNPKADRLTRTVEMEIDENGKVLNYNIFLSVINSNKKMSYESVNKIFNTGKVPDDYKDFIEKLNLHKELNQKLSEKRNDRGSLDFYSTELKFDFDEKEKIVDIHTHKRGEAESIIENAMLLANECIANHSKWMNVPFVYRNHDMPNEKKITEAVKFIRTLGFKVKSLSNASSPKVLQNIIQTLSNKEEFPILSNILLSAMCRAKYSAHNSGHYGLALNEYTHFTSPIRRLPDLLVHTLLDYFENFDMTKDELKTLEMKLQKICDFASFKERQADAAEIKAQRLKVLEYVEEHIGTKFEATVIGITPSFIKVKTINGIEGLVKIDDMIGDKFIFDKNSNVLKGKNSGYIYKLGLKIKVTAKEVSKPTLDIYFYAGNDKQLKGIQYILK